MIEINETELNVANEIVNNGLLKAAESLSFFMKEKIALDKMDCDFNKSTDPSDFTTKNGENIHLLYTEILGDLKGVCCLIFSEEEADKLRSSALPPEIMDNPEIMAEMSDGILLEVDNIISASVITQFSNILKHKMYGGVPHIEKFNKDQVNQFIKGKLEENMYIISFNTNFISPSVDFSPQFLWFFDNSFSESIQKYSSLKNQVNNNQN